MEVCAINWYLKSDLIYLNLVFKNGKLGQKSSKYFIRRFTTQKWNLFLSQKNAYKEAMFVQRFKLDCICAFLIILFDVKRNIDDIIKYTVKKDINNLP